MNIHMQGVRNAIKNGLIAEQTTIRSCSTTAPTAVQRWMVMGMREKLIEILRVPIFPHELADPTEVVADYLLDNDVVPVVRCKDCKHYNGHRYCINIAETVLDDDFCSYGERKDNDYK